MFDWTKVQKIEKDPVLSNQGFIESRYYECVYNNTFNPFNALLSQGGLDN